MLRNSQDNNAHVDHEALQELKSYIDAVVRNIPTSFSYDDREDLAQSSWIKYWRLAQVKEIRHPKAYIRCIIRSIFVSMMRQRQPFTPLVIMEDGEIDPDQGKILVGLSAGMQNPEHVCEQKLAIIECMEEIITAMESLPPRQRQAAACTLYDEVDDVPLYVKTLFTHRVHVEYLWPTEGKDKQRLQASYGPARKSIARHMNVASLDYQRKM